MAIIKPSALVSGMSGKLNGSFLQTKGNRIQLCNNTRKPKRLQTKFRELQGLRAVASADWAHQHPDNVQAWENAAKQQQYTDEFGDPYYLTGRELFMQCYCYRETSNYPYAFRPTGIPSQPLLFDLGEAYIDETATLHPNVLGVQLSGESRFILRIGYARTRTASQPPNGMRSIRQYVGMSASTSILLLGYLSLAQLSQSNTFFFSVQPCQWSKGYIGKPVVKRARWWFE